MRRFFSFSAFRKRLNGSDAAYYGILCAICWEPALAWPFVVGYSITVLAFTIHDIDVSRRD